MCGRKPRRNTKMVAVASLHGRERNSFSPFHFGGEVMCMYLTLEQLLLLGGFIVALLQFVLTFINKKK